MTNILLLSDTHSYIDNNILKYVKQADEVWHAGDIGSLEVTDAIKALKPLKGVHGNIDDYNYIALKAKYQNMVLILDENGSLVDEIKAPYL